MDDIGTVGVVLGIIAILLAGGAIAYTFTSSPEPADISGLESSINLITSTQNNKITALTSDLNNLRKDVNAIDSDVDQDDLDDLEDDLERYCRDEIDDECNCNDIETEVEDCFQSSVNKTEFHECLYPTIV